MEVRSALKNDKPGFKPIFAEFRKIDEEQRMVFGYAATETRDQQGEIVRLAAIEAALPEYMRFGNIREMHQPWAVGTAEEAAIDGTGFWLGAHVVDDEAWKKVKAKVYKGFSIGGKVTSRDPVDRTIITGLELNEVSIVDRPANPDAVYTVVKRVDGILYEQPLQKWDCGDPAHQHRAKVDASVCMQDRALKLRKTADAATEIALKLQSAAGAAADAVGKREFSDEQRQHAADSGHALPDGSFPIENKSDLENAIHAVGRAKDPDKAKAHIKERAKDLGAEDLIPDSWKSVRSVGLQKVQVLADYSAALKKASGAEDRRIAKENYDRALLEIEKAATKDTGTGQFSTHEKQAARAHRARASHQRAAAKARDEERTQRAAAERSLKAGDAESVALHEHLAGAAASLSQAHDRAASQYRDLASRHEKAIGKLNH